jgi:hypothetical protein
MSHQDWLRSVRPTRQTPKMKARKRVTGRKPNVYAVALDPSQTYKAFTKSEARAMLKAKLNVDSLAPGIKLIRIK